jgi:hypothetical protein
MSKVSAYRCAAEKCHAHAEQSREPQFRKLWRIIESGYELLARIEGQWEGVSDADEDSDFGQGSLKGEGDNLPGSRTGGLLPSSRTYPCCPAAGHV